MSVLDNIFLPKKKENEFSFQRFLKDLEDGKFRDKMCLGICEERGGSYLLKDFSVEPNAIFVGAMGSGKSYAACFSLETWLAANGDQTIIFIVDAVKGANDYKSLFKFKDSNQVYPVLSSEIAVHRVIDLLYEEAMARKSVFNDEKAESIKAYERNSGKKMARLILMMEEFHSIPYAIMNFDRDFKVAGTTANKFHTIMRIGRALGIWVMAASQRATKSDIPSEVVPNFTQRQVFRVQRADAAYILGSIKAADIRSDQKGRCETEYGSVQFPFFEKEDQEIFLERYVKPLDAECAYLTPDIITNYLNGKTTEDLYKLKKLSDLVQNIENYDAEIVVTMLHKKMKHTVETVDSLGDPNGVSHIITFQDGKKVAVLLRIGEKAKILPKHISRLVKGIESYNCSSGIIYTSAMDFPQAVYNRAIDSKIELIDHEDMISLARRIENQTIDLSTVSPTELADPSKESGIYQQEKQVKTKLTLVEPQPDAAPAIVSPPEMKPILKDIIPVIQNAPVVKLRRVPVKATYIPKKDEAITLIVHAQRTKNNELFRVLFYILNEDVQKNCQVLKHRFYVDHKLAGTLDQETAEALDVSGVKEWNSHKDTLTGVIFENKINTFFNNFRLCEFPISVVCWERDAAWLAHFLPKPKKPDQPAQENPKNPKFNLPEKPIIFEDWIQELHNKELTRNEIIGTYGMKPEKLDMFYPIEVDRIIWEKLNA